MAPLQSRGAIPISGSSGMTIVPAVNNDRAVYQEV
jgi:hypothetical protein